MARNPFLTALILLALAPTVLVMPYINLMPVFARDELGMGSSGLGLAAGGHRARDRGRLALRRAVVAHVRRLAGAQIVTAAAFAVLVLVFAVTPLVAARGGPAVRGGLDERGLPGDQPDGAPAERRR